VRRGSGVGGIVEVGSKWMTHVTEQGEKIIVFRRKKVVTKDPLSQPSANANANDIRSTGSSVKEVA
jgi:hypothetical protein